MCHFKVGDLLMPNSREDLTYGLISRNTKLHNLIFNSLSNEDGRKHFLNGNAYTLHEIDISQAFANTCDEEKTTFCIVLEIKDISKTIKVNNKIAEHSIKLMLALELIVNGEILISYFVEDKQQDDLLTFEQAFKVL